MCIGIISVARQQVRQELLVILKQNYKLYQVRELEDDFPYDLQEWKNMRKKSFRETFFMWSYLLHYIVIDIYGRYKYNFCEV